MTSTCTVHGCTAQHVARGMCRRHYSRWRRGAPLADPVLPEHGTPSRYGLYGILDDDGETVLCHECGERFRSVAAHLAAGAHEITARDYKIAHGLPLGLGLVSRHIGDALSERSCDRVGTAVWVRLEAARDPAAEVADEAC